MGKADSFLVIEGDREVIAALNGLADEVARRVTTRAVQKAGVPTLAAARQNMPADSGDAREALTLRKGRNRRRSAGRVSFEVVFTNWQALIEKTRPDNPSGAKYPEGFFYPAVVEFGSEALNREPVAPLRRAYEETRNEAVRIGLAELAAGVNRAVRRAAKQRRG
jgi:HK97 gp10 family phage protein